MELRHLRYFVAVAEEKHFGRAARRLHIAQPPLSRQIQALESELGFAVLNRSRRRVELTPAGQVLLEHARRIFDAVELGLREAKRASVGESGRIVVGYPSSVAYTGIARLLRAYRERFPGVEVTLRELSPNDQVEALRTMRLDVGFVRAPVEEPALAWERFRREPLLLALSADHPLAQLKRIALKRVAREPFVGFPRQRSPGYFDQLMALCRAAGFTPRIVQEAAQLDLLSLVEAGFGVAIVPESVREMRREGVALRPIVGSPHTELLVAWNRANLTPTVRGFLEIVREIGPSGGARITSA